MQRSLKRACALMALAALSSPSALGWATALHTASGDHHRAGPSPRGGPIRLDLALHGHGHGNETPRHGHPLLLGSGAPLPAKTQVLIGAMIGRSPELVVVAAPGLRLLSLGGSTHDPPPRVDTVSVLRI